jgi:hypothetical protein
VTKRNNLVGGAKKGIANLAEAGEANKKGGQKTSFNKV